MTDDGWPGDGMMNEARAQLAFLEARYEEEHAVARRAMTFTTGNWTVMGKTHVDLDCREDAGAISTDSDPHVADHIVYHRPTAVVLAVDARMRLLDRARTLMDDESWLPRFIGECIVYDLVQAYAETEAFRPEWRAEARSDRNTVLDGEVVSRATSLAPPKPTRTTTEGKSDG